MEILKANNESDYCAANIVFAKITGVNLGMPITLYEKSNTYFSSHMCNCSMFDIPPVWI